MIYIDRSTHWFLFCFLRHPESTGRSLIRYRALSSNAMREDALRTDGERRIGGYGSFNRVLIS